MDLNILLDWFKHYNYVCIPIFAFIIDTIIGDPNSKFHPVALIGRVISFYEAVFYKDTDNDGYVDKDGKNLELNIYGTAGGNTRANSTVAELLESQLKTAGIKANIKIAENLEDIKKNLEFDLLFQNWQTVSTGDSQWFLDNAFKTDGSGNYGKYSNKELDNLINKLATTFDVKERQKITKEASQLIIDEAYGTYIVSQANVNVSNNKVENMHNFPIDYYFLTADTKITK